MVRFSDMLSGNGDSQEASAPASPPRPDDESPAPVAETEREPEDESAVPDDTSPAQSPEDVLDRLTQYASSARAPDAPEPDPPADETDEPLTSVGDDLLPHPKGDKSKRRRK